MYAITATGFRTIGSVNDLQAGESAVDTIPQSLLDAIAATGSLRAANSASIRSQADQAIVNLRLYRDTPAPTNAQTVAVVKLLCRACIALVRLQLAQLDATD